MWKLRCQLAAFAMFVAIVFATTVPAQMGATDADVLRRMNTMQAANAALTTLGNMSNGRVSFDKDQASAARHNLIIAVRKIPRRFRRNRRDPASHAKPEIWFQWEYFVYNAGVAKRAALAIRVNSLSALQATLPQMLVACMNCHQTFRAPDG